MSMGFTSYSPVIGEPSFGLSPRSSNRGQLVGGPVDKPIIGNPRVGIDPMPGYTQPIDVMPGQSVSGPITPAGYQQYFQQMRDNIENMNQSLSQFERMLSPNQSITTSSPGGKSAGSLGGTSAGPNSTFLY